MGREKALRSQPGSPCQCTEPGHPIRDQQLELCSGAKQGPCYVGLVTEPLSALFSSAHWDHSTLQNDCKLGTSGLSRGSRSWLMHSDWLRGSRSWLMDSDWLLSDYRVVRCYSCVCVPRKDSRESLPNANSSGGRSPGIFFCLYFFHIFQTLHNGHLLYLSSRKDFKKPY